MRQVTLVIQPPFQVPGKPRCFSGSPFAIKVQRILQYKGLHFAVREVGWLERNQVLPTLSASRKLPVLQYDDETIEDSTVIAHTLEARHPQPPLLPRDDALGARCHFLEEWADEALYWYGLYEQRRISDPQIVTDAYYTGLPEGFRVAAATTALARAEENLDRQGIGRYPADKVKADVRRGLDALVRLLQIEPFLAGPALSLADIAVFAQLHRRSAGTNPWLESELRARPDLVTWMARVDQLTTARDVTCAR
jgi:glutathione S-transferase